MRLSSRYKASTNSNKRVTGDLGAILMVGVLRGQLIGG